MTVNAHGRDFVYSSRDGVEFNPSIHELHSPANIVTIRYPHILFEIKLIRVNEGMVVRRELIT